MKLKEVIKDVIEDCDKNGLVRVSDDMILDCSTRIFNSGNINSNREKEELATDKQVYRLKKLGLYRDGISKKEAMQLIKDHK